MFGIKNTAGGSLILASALVLTSGYAMAQRDGQGPKDGERPAKRQADGKQKLGEDGERMRRGPRDGEGMHRWLFEGMELSDDQKAQIHEVMKKHGDERKAWHEAHQEEFQALREKMRDAREAQDKDAMEALREEGKALMRSAPKPDTTHDEIRAILNEDQREIFDERVEKMRERAEQWRERRQDGPPPGPGMDPDGDGPPRHMDGQGPGHPGARLFGNLDLTDEQQAKLKETMQSDMTREEKMAAVREMLTDEQKAQLDENIEKMRKFREENRGEDGDRPRRDGSGPGGEGGRRGGPDGPDDQLDL